MKLKTWMSAVVMTLLAHSFATAQQYTITDLGVFGSFTGSYAADNNNNGQVAGCSDNSVLPTIPCNESTPVPSQATLWSATGLQPLPYLTGYDSSVAFVVNDSGAVVGFQANLQTGAEQGFVWTQSSGMVALPPLFAAGGFSIADAITSKGVIVGESVVANGDVHAVIWTQSGGTYHIHDIGFLPNAPYTYPYDINEKLQVTGIAYFNQAGTSYHAFLWSQKVGWKDLGTLKGGTNSAGDWMTDSGVVAGVSTSTKYPNGVTVLWDTNGKIYQIGTLPGGTSSSPGYISDAGQVLGQSTVTGGANHAFIWTQTTGMQDLNNMIPQNSGWVLEHASSIDKNGNIVGVGSINGAYHGFLLTPVS
jgi:probable HAF family extracellular repeat protein